MAERSFSGIGRAELIEIIREHERTIQQYQSAPTLRGWWCTCDIFNDENIKVVEECRGCGLAKSDLCRIPKSHR